jgi:hypothetical protein
LNIKKFHATTILDNEFCNWIALAGVGRSPLNLRSFLGDRSLFLADRQQTQSLALEADSQGL